MRDRQSHNIFLRWDLLVWLCVQLLDRVLEKGVHLYRKAYPSEESFPQNKERERINGRYNGGLMIENLFEILEYASTK